MYATVPNNNLEEDRNDVTIATTIDIKTCLFITIDSEDINQPLNYKITPSRARWRHDKNHKRPPTPLITPVIFDMFMKGTFIFTVDNLIRLQ